MASITPRKNKNGEIVSYRIRVRRGRDVKPFETTYPEKGMTIPATWSKRKIESEVKKYAAAFEQKCIRGEISTERKTFAEYAEYVLDLKEQSGVKHSTLNRYRELLDRINDTDLNGIGHMKLSVIRPEHLNRFYTTLGKTARNKQTGKALSAKTIFEHHAFISVVLGKAFKEGYVPFNVAQRAEPPKKPKYEAECFEIAEVEQIIDALESEPLEWKAIVHLMIATGARRGEILGLQWQNVNFETNVIYLCNNTLWSKERGIYHGTLKTGENRHVTVPADAMEILKAWKAVQNQQRIRFGKEWVDKDGYVFTSCEKKKGCLINPESITNWFNRFSKRHELPHINPHKFRHTQASMLINAGMDIVTVSKRLGHKQVSTTMNVYSHIMEGANQKAADMIEGIIYNKNIQ